ncbi:putative ISH8 transposase [Natronorubrum tibetense GA33]|uniref:Putative ISH8 transposase n=1 Tax=Natronorubrum tibetense GA33 TaxID=1114856 RepID=L9VP98_9EURY|nr:putative ISH8 transposase [Natronorubrum tibetense GA33]
MHELLTDDFAGRKKEQAEARLHLLHNITDQTIDDYTVTDEKPTTVRNSPQGRGLKIASFCLIGRTSATAVSR